MVLIRQNNYRKKLCCNRRKGKFIIVFIIAIKIRSYFSVPFFSLFYFSFFFLALSFLFDFFLSYVILVSIGVFFKKVFNKIIQKIPIIKCKMIFIPNIQMIGENKIDITWLDPNHAVNLYKDENLKIAVSALHHTLLSKIYFYNYFVCWGISITLVQSCLFFDVLEGKQCEKINY